MTNEPLCHSFSLNLEVQKFLLVNNVYLSLTIKVYTYEPHVL